VIYLCVRVIIYVVFLTCVSNYGTYHYSCLMIVLCDYIDIRKS